MNVLFSITYYAPYVSGLTMYAKRLAEALVIRGYSCRVLSMQYDEGLPTEESIGGVGVRRSPVLWRVSKGYLSWQWIVDSYKEVKKADMVIVNLPQLEGWILAVFARLMGKPVLSIYHCELVMPSGFINEIIGTILELANVFTLALSQMIVTYTQDYADFSRLLKMFPEKVKTIYPPVPEPTIFDKEKEILKKQIRPTDIIIGVAARLAREKGVEYLIDALPLLQKALPTKKIKLVFAGPMNPVGEERYKAWIMRKVKDVQDHLVFLGNLPDKQMGAFYASLDALVLPSVNSTEAFGIVQVEAMYCGTPVVASNLPGVRVPIGKTGMGLVVPIRDPGAIARAIYTILKDKKMYTKPKNMIEKEFGIKKTIAFYETNIERLIGESVTV